MIPATLRTPCRCASDLRELLGAAMSELPEAYAARDAEADLDALLELPAFDRLPGEFEAVVARVDAATTALNLACDEFSRWTASEPEIRNGVRGWRRVVAVSGEVSP